MTEHTEPVPVSVGRCKATVSDGERWSRYHRCPHKAWAEGLYWGKIVPLCRVHHPTAKAERRAKREPTRWEREMDALHKLMLQRAIWGLSLVLVVGPRLQAKHADQLEETVQVLLAVAEGALGYLEALPESQHPDAQWFVSLRAAIAAARKEE